MMDMIFLKEPEDLPRRHKGTKEFYADVRYFAY